MTYRGNPTCGGQGVYIKYLSRALRDLGHRVDVISGPPYPELADGITLHKLPSLDLYNPDHLFKVKNLRDLKAPINQFEFISMCLGGFPEPATFGLRVFKYFLKKRPHYDIIHDNQCLSYGILGLKHLGYSTTATIHHPITVDRDIELKTAKTCYAKLKVRRWYSFIGMQKKVSRRFPSIITVSERSRHDIGRIFGIPLNRFRVVPNGINTDFFFPMPEVRRSDNHILATSSADSPLKGIAFLLKAIASIKANRNIRLTVVGTPKENGQIRKLVDNLKIQDCVTFTGQIKNEDLARYYAEATMAVIPSLYEGFGMPAGEAMACGTPVISSAGGALPEVVGDAGIIVPPGDENALETAIISLLDNPGKRDQLGRAGLERVKRSFTWAHAAQNTVNVYREMIHADG